MAQRYPLRGDTTSIASTTPVESRSITHLDVIRDVLGADRAIATLLDVSLSQISRWRRGQVPDPDNADRLAGLSLVVEAGHTGLRWWSSVWGDWHRGAVSRPA